MRKAITLTELLIAISLMAVIILGAISFDIASRRFLRSTETSVQVLNELVLVIDHINKNITLASGDIIASGIVWNAAILPATVSTLTIRQDLTGINPGNYGVHTQAQYLFDTANHTIDFDPDTSVANNTIGLTNRFVDAGAFAVTVPAAGAARSVVAVTDIGIRFDPAQTIDTSSNPQVDINDFNGNPTIEFVSRSHSWN